MRSGDERKKLEGWEKLEEREEGVGEWSGRAGGKLMEKMTKKIPSFIYNRQKYWRQHFSFRCMKMIYSFFSHSRALKNTNSTSKNYITEQFSLNSWLYKSAKHYRKLIHSIYYLISVVAVFIVSSILNAIFGWKFLKNSPLKKLHWTTQSNENLCTNNNNKVIRLIFEEDLIMLNDEHLFFN